MNSFLLPIGGFVASALADVAWVYFVTCVGSKKPINAGFATIAIMICGSVMTLCIVEKDPVAYTACLVGGFVGTWLTVSFGK